MGVVYHAFDKQRGEEVALKTLHLMSPQTLLLFKQEFRGLIDVVHPNLVSLYELGVASGVWFIAMELVRGCNFLEYLGRPSHQSEAETVTGAPAIESARHSAVTYSPLATLPDLDKLRAITIQLVRGVDALHTARKLHRDIKPSNVLVSHEGRVVLVDFGLVTEIDTGLTGQSARGPLRGTAFYMAPELFGPDRADPSPASDWYSLGVMLYEALTGMHPFPEWAATLNRRPPLAPSSLVRGIPAAFDDICLDLLQSDPTKRSAGRKLLSYLGGEAAPEREYSVPAARPDATFVGRERELARLDEALARTRAGRPGVVLVSGTSGMGKTTLVRRFLRDAREQRRALVLEGRCYDRESVPYKAFDSLIDRLAEHLAGLGPNALSVVSTPDFHLLAELFPVLQKVQDGGAVDPASRDREDLPERRRRAFAAFRHLLKQLSLASPLVLFIDDLQWADLDSGALLAELLAPPDAPQLLLVACRRSGDAATSEQAPLFFDSASPTTAEAVDIEHLHLAPLAPADSRRLAERLLEVYHVPSGADVANTIAIDSAGYPLFIHELARDRQARDGAPGAMAHQTLEQLIGRRIDLLDADARGLLQTIVVAGRPVRAPVVLSAARVRSHDRETVAALRAAGFVIVWGAADHARLEAAHDRIRQVVWDRLSEGEVGALHERLARELEHQGDPDLEALFEHFLGAGIKDRAGEYARRAAEQADRALAFERASELYDKAVALVASEVDRSELLVKAAAALANAGHAQRAAEQYLAAATAAESSSVVGTGPRQLRRLAAEQHLKNGDLGAGWEVMRQVLDELGIPVPRSHWRAVVYSGWRRTLFLLRGARSPEHQPKNVPPRLAERLDVLWSVSTSFSMVNVILSDAFRCMHLLDVLETGQRSAVCRALAYEVAMETTIGGNFLDKNCQRLLARVAALVGETKDAYDEAWQHLALACVAYTTVGFRRTVEACSRSEEIFRDQCPGAYWERSTVLVYKHIAMAYLGDYNGLRRSQQEFLRDAAQRRTLFGVIECQASENIVTWMAEDRPEEALEASTKLLSQQTTDGATWPTNGYRAQQYSVLIARMHTDLYRGVPADGWQALLADWGRLRSSFIESLRGFHSELSSMRGRTAVALATTMDDATSIMAGGRAWTRRHLVADATRMLARLRRDKHTLAAPWAAMLEAGLACLNNDVAAARRALETAVASADAAEMAGYREAARYGLSTLMPSGPERDRTRARAEDWLRGQGVVKPEQFIAALCPGIRAAT